MSQRSPLAEPTAPAAAPPGAFASPADTDRHGHYAIRRDPGDQRPLYRFEGRISTDGSTPFAAEAGRYHLYAGWFCPWAQRVTIAHALAGLDDVISVSYVDGGRDGRGWAFRERYGADPVNGFTLLRHAYDATEPGFDGHVSVPTLWDRTTGTVASNQFRAMGIDLATRFRALATPLVETYPADLAGDIEDLDRWIGPAVNQGVGPASGTGRAADAARRTLLAAFDELDRRLADRRYLLGDRLTEADIRLFVTLVRFDHTANARRTICAGLDTFPHLWAYARDLYAIPAFRDTTDFTAFGTGTGTGTDPSAWNEPSHRGGLGAVTA
jgi:putative glutathione S-transferase